MKRGACYHVLEEQPASLVGCCLKATVNEDEKDLVCFFGCLWTFETVMAKDLDQESMSFKSHRDKASHNESQVQSRWGFGTMGWLGYLLGFHSQSVLPMHAVKTVF